MSEKQEWLSGLVDPIVLALVAEHPSYGYEIIKVVNERTNGEFVWKEGTLYPCLHRLEAEGLVRSRWEGPEGGRQRKVYRTTRRGAARARHQAVEWETFSAAVTALMRGPALA